MKTMIYAACLSLGLMACSNTKTDSDNAAKSAVASKTDASTQERSDVIRSYMDLKDALVKTNSDEAKSYANALKLVLKQQGMPSEMVEAANTISMSEDVEVQRAQFKSITDGLITVLKQNGTEDGVFVQYCPMAFNNSGANWLSLSEEIRNPYFGDRMLKCGSVQEKL